MILGGCMGMYKKCGRVKWLRPGDFEMSYDGSVAKREELLKETI